MAVRADMKLRDTDFFALPETTKKCELLEGEVILSPSPSRRHQRVSVRLSYLLESWCEKQQSGEVLTCPMDVRLDTENVVQPDVFLVLNEHRERLRDWGMEGAPDLVMEILSPSNAQVDRGLKRQLYAAHGVREYWLVDPQEARISIYRLQVDAETVAAEHTDGESRSFLLPELSLALNDIFNAH